MSEMKCNKMVLAVLQGDDYEDLVAELNKNGFYVTLLNTMGGFLRKKSVTIMIGLPEERLPAALEILKQQAGRRTETVYENVLMPQDTISSVPPMVPVQVSCGGATVFVLNMDHMEHY